MRIDTLDSMHIPGASHLFGSCVGDWDGTLPHGVCVFDDGASLGQCDSCLDECDAQQQEFIRLCEALYPWCIDTAFEIAKDCYRSCRSHGGACSKTCVLRPAPESDLRNPPQRDLRPN